MDQLPPCEIILHQFLTKEVGREKVMILCIRCIYVFFYWFFFFLGESFVVLIEISKEDEQFRKVPILYFI